MKIKGQNLRLFVDTTKPFASALTCSVNIQPSFVDTTTKDSTGGWQENQLIGNTWTADVEQLVIEKSVLPMVSRTSIEQDVTIGGSTVTVYRAGTPVSVAPGERIDIKAVGVEPVILIKNSSTYSVVGTHSTNEASYTNTGDESQSVFIAAGDTALNIYYVIVDNEGFVGADTINMALEGRSEYVSLRMTYGEQNREGDDDLDILRGTARVTNLQITAQNREAVVVRCTLQGIGSLELCEPSMPDVEFFADEACTLRTNTIIPRGTVYAKLHRSYEDIITSYRGNRNNIEIGNGYDTYLVIVGQQDADSEGQTTPFVEGQVIPVHSSRDETINIDNAYYPSQIIQ